MPDLKISEFTSVALDGTEVFPVVQAGANAKATTQAVADLGLSALNVVSNVLSDLLSSHNVLSNRVSTNSATGGAGSVTSNEASAISAQAASAISQLQSVMSQAISVVSQAASAAEAHASTASAAATSVDAHVNTVSGALATLSLNVSAISTAVSNEASVRAVSVQTASAAATSADGHANTVSAALAAVSLNLTSVQSTVSHLASIVSNVSANSAGGSATGVQNVVNLLSNKISQVVAAGGITSAQAADLVHSVLTTEYSARTSIGGATSTKGLQSAINNLSLQISSLNSVVSNALSAGDVVHQHVSLLHNAPNAITTLAPMTRRVLSVAGAVVASAALADVTGMSISVKSGGVYKFESFMMMTRGGAATVHGFGITFPAMTALRGQMEHIVSAAASVGTATKLFYNSFDDTASGSIIVSVSASQGALLPTFLKTEALMVVSANGVVQMQAKAAGGTSAISIIVGSYIEARRIN